MRPLVALAFALTIVSCARDPVIREYQEIVITPSPVESAFSGSGAAVAAAPVSGGPLSWQTPSAWNELPADGIRLGAFRVDRDGRQAETTIVLLSGAAGGVEANVSRWLDQLGLQLATQELTSFLATGEPLSTDTGLRLTLYDFTSLPAPAGASMIVALGPVSDQTLFVKMSGDEAMVAAARPDFEELVRSIGVDASSRS